MNAAAMKPNTLYAQAPVKFWITVKELKSDFSCRKWLWGIIRLTLDDKEGENRSQ